MGLYLIFSENTMLTKGQLASFLTSTACFVGNVNSVVSSFNDFMESCVGSESLF